MDEIDEEPFGRLWEKEMETWEKADLIQFVKLNLIELQATKQKLQQGGVVRAEGSDGAAVAAVGQRSAGTVAEARDCGCTYSIDCDERKDCVKKQIDTDFARKSSEGQP